MKHTDLDIWDAALNRITDRQVPTVLEEAAEYVNGLTDEFLQDCGPEFQRLAMYATVILSELNGRRDTPSEKHCAWCDGDGRCNGV